MNFYVIIVFDSPGELLDWKNVKSRYLPFRGDVWDGDVSDEVEKRRVIIPLINIKSMVTKNVPFCGEYKLCDEMTNI